MGVLFKKDASEIYKNKMSLIVTVLIIFVLPLWFNLMPSDVEETLFIGIHAPGLEDIFNQMNTSEEALQLTVYNDSNALKVDVENGDVTAGIVLPEDFVRTLLAGGKPRVDLYFPSIIPSEAREPIEAFMEELSFQVTQQRLPVNLNTEIIGQDYAGRQLPFRDQTKPLWITFVLLIEIMALAYLIIEEKQTGAIYALLVTPVTTAQIFIAKIIVGTMLASIETLVIIIFLGSFGANQLAILANVLLGGILATGFAFLVATPARDLKSSFSWLMIPYIVLLIPPFTVIYPQAATWVVKVLPSYYLADTFNKILNQGIGLSGVWQNLAILAIFDAVILTMGMLVLRRKFQ